jgi:hypothetical protein
MKGNCESCHSVTKLHGVYVGAPPERFLVCDGCDLKKTQEKTHG